jgi:hypothetical protein
MEALRCLGVKHIPVYHTEYMSFEVVVKSWYYIIFTPNPFKLLKMFDSIESPLTTNRNSSF